MAEQIIGINEKMEKYISSLYLNYNEYDILVVPLKKFETKETAEIHNDLIKEVILCPSSIEIQYEDNSKEILKDKDIERYNIRKIKKEKAQKMGKPINPQDYSQEELHKIIFSDEYIMNPIKDFENTGMNISELYLTIYKEYKNKNRFSLSYLASGVYEKENIQAALLK